MPVWRQLPPPQTGQGYVLEKLQDLEQNQHNLHLRTSMLEDRYMMGNALV
jgi:hypothetical protein